MFKNLSTGDQSIQRLETFANQSLTIASTGVQFLTGVSGSSAVTESAN
jgi:hypothetical protein